MPGFEHGYERAITEIVIGVFLSIVLNAFIQSGLLDPSWLLYFKILNMLSSIILIMAMPYWGTTYLIGWLFGLYVMWQAGLVGILDLVIYFGIPLLFLIMRIAHTLDLFY